MDTVPVSEVTEDKMVAMMVGREISNYYFKPEPPKTKEIVFEVRNLTRAGMFNNVSFKLYKGEIPVSYTHLDVYKRQVLNSAGNMV